MNLEKQIKLKLNKYKNDPEFMKEYIDILEGELKAMKKPNPIGKWIINILISIDQLGNTILGGDPDETISSRLGKLKLKYGGTIPWFHPLAGLIDWGCNKIDPHHSIDAIESDEGKNGLL